MVNQVLSEGMDPDILTEVEMAWLENRMMEKFIEQLALTNPMVFVGIEDPMMN